MIIAYIILIFTAIQLIVSLANLLAETTLPETNKSHSCLVSVLIPARNEEQNIGSLLEDLVHQDYKNIEIVVYDDQSEDKTAKLVDEYSKYDSRIRMIGTGTLPEGWLGKNYACHSLAKEAKGSFLLFLDADVRVSGNLIARSISYSEKHDLRLISIFPKQIIESTGERITVPNMNYILLSLLPLALVRRLSYPSLSAANGQFMFFRSEDYNAIKPHEAVRADKVEDISIARMFKRRGLKTACMLGDDTITCRMYRGFSEALKGFSKNVTAFFGNSFTAALIFWIVTTFGILAVAGCGSGIVIAAYIAAYVLTRIFISAASRQNMFFNLLYIIPLQVSMGLFILTAFINRKFRKFEWKGRKIG